MSSYVRFVLKHKDAQTIWGDVARDVLSDSSVDRSWSWKQFNLYMDKVKPCKAAYDAMLEMRDECRAQKKLKSQEQGQEQEQLPA